jgi:carbamoyltransferase
LTVDGVGEWATAVYGVGVGNRITILKELHYPHSVGLLYSAFTAFLGFEVNEGEWKVMGLAPYGKPRYTDKVRNVVKIYPDGSIALDMSYFAFPYSSDTTYSTKFVSLFGDPIPPAESHAITIRAADIAASIQAVTDEILLAMARHIRKVTHTDNLCYAGGVALNSVTNYKMLTRAGFRNIFIQPAAGDSGGALGAALYCYHHILGKTKRYRMEHAYWGQENTNAEIAAFLRKERVRFKKLPENKLIQLAVDTLADGRVIGWMQGKFEWGPRALGNRSILADARNPKMKDIINAKVKFREAFRPFAPSILGEHAAEVLELPENYHEHEPLRYMLYVTKVRPAWRKRVPAITHEDYSTRPQLVYKKESPLYHTLLTAFYRKTGIPLLLNTSFNLRGEPIVATPGDAYSTFKRSGIDMLIMGNVVLSKGNLSMGAVAPSSP